MVTQVAHDCVVGSRVAGPSPDPLRVVLALAGMAAAEVPARRVHLPAVSTRNAYGMLKTPWSQALSAHKGCKRGGVHLCI